MAWELRDGSGSLFKNERKEEPTHADYRGEIMVDGKIYWLNAWIKEGKKGKFMSLTVKPKADKAPNVLPNVQGGIADLEDDPIPF